jgi:Ser/Thr protein kinase RdoA (MazF antagonist)
VTADAKAPIFGVRSLRAGHGDFSTADAERIASRHWGIDAAARRLQGEVDENFHLDSDAGEFLLKVAPADEPAELTDLVTQALLHVERHGGSLAAQRIRPTLAGEPIATLADDSGVDRRVRVTTFVPGTMLRSISVDRPIREELGANLARLAAVLRDFDHPAVDRELSWDLRHAYRMRAMLEQLPTTPRRRELGAALDDFEERIVPRLEPLPLQVVHNDLTRDNVVRGLDGRFTIIDFGDVVRTQRVNDIAVAMSDHIEEGERAFAPGLDLLRGYCRVQALEPAELDLVYDLVRTRIVTRIVGGEWRSSRFPENRDYLARNLEWLVDALEHMPARPGAADAAGLAAVAEESGR